MLRRFLLSLFSSWAVNPLGVLVAHYFGVANTPTVILLLLGAGACVPFQLLMNECLAVGVEHKRYRVTYKQLAAVLSMQSIAYLISVEIMSPKEFATDSVVILGVLLGISTCVSYFTALAYYGLVIRSVISMREAVLVGALPGLISFAVYLTYCLMPRWAALPEQALLFVVGFPALVQFAYVTSRTRQANSAPSQEPTRALAVVSNLAVSTCLALLSGLTIIGTFLRDSIASHSVQYTAVILVVLNSLMSLANTITRSRHFQASVSAERSSNFLWLTLAFGVAASLSWKANSLLGIVLALCVTQLSIIWAVEQGRRMHS